MCSDLESRIDALERELGIGQPTREQRLERIARRWLRLHEHGVEFMCEFTPAEIRGEAQRLSVRDMSA